MSSGKYGKCQLSITLLHKLMLHTNDMKASKARLVQDMLFCEDANVFCDSTLYIVRKPEEVAATIFGRIACFLTLHFGHCLDSITVYLVMLYIYIYSDIYIYIYVLYVFLCDIYVHI